MWQSNGGLFEDWEGDASVELGSIDADLQERAQFGIRTNVFQKLERLADALLVRQMTMADTEEAPRAENNSTARLRAVSHFGEA